jgi:hypothetical protein
MTTMLRLRQIRARSWPVDVVYPPLSMFGPGPVKDWSGRYSASSGDELRKQLTRSTLSKLLGGTEKHHAVADNPATRWWRQSRLARRRCSL